MEERGQLYTLEGIFAALIIFLGLLFAIQATTTTPGAAGATNPNAIQQDDVYVDDVLSSMNRSTIEDATLYWGSDGFHCTPSGEFYTGSWSCTNDPARDTGEAYPPNPFGAVLEQRLDDRYSYNVRVAYNDSGSLAYQRMVYQGEPGVGAVRGATSIVLYENDHRQQSNGGEGCGLSDSGCSIYAPNIGGSSGGSSGLYNVVHVELVIWRE